MNTVSVITNNNYSVSRLNKVQLYQENRTAKSIWTKKTAKSIWNEKNRKINLERKKPQNQFATTIKFVLHSIGKRYIRHHSPALDRLYPLKSP